MDHLKLTHDILSVDAVLKLVSSEKCGAVSMFVGTTRDNFDGKQVLKLEYEAYEPMALKVMKKMCEDIRKKWEQIHNIAIYHRLGTVPVLEASVIIAISSPHRIDSIAAVQYCIENLKDVIPDDFQSREQFVLDPDKVQINITQEEMRNRMRKFTEMKREQNNINNIQEFIKRKRRDVDDDSTCARAEAVVIKSKDSKSHLKVLRTQNEWGPQTKVANEPNKSADDMPKSYSGIEERMRNVEDKLNLARPISGDIYSRLKKIEDKLLEIESISPEYAKYWFDKSSNKVKRNEESEENAPKRHKFSSKDILDKIRMLES